MRSEKRLANTPVMRSLRRSSHYQRVGGNKPALVSGTRLRYTWRSVTITRSRTERRMQRANPVNPSNRRFPIHRVVRINQPSSTTYFRTHGWVTLERTSKCTSTSAFAQLESGLEQRRREKVPARAVLFRQSAGQSTFKIVHTTQQGGSS